jgi:hypothetical protein
MPGDDRAPGTTIRGDLLSCYTASIAEYLAGVGIDVDLAIGAQAYLAVRPAESGACEFVQFHTPLRGDVPTHSLRLARRRADSPEEAAALITAEVARSGRAIVVGDTFNVPWQVAHATSHAPHWFVVDDVRDDAASVHVTDRFEFINDAGEQRPFQGWLAASDLPALATANPDPNPVFAWRDQHAFADREDPDAVATAGYQWYELDGTPWAAATDAAGAAPGAAPLLDRLAATQAAAGQAPPGARPGDGWTSGPDAVALLAEHFTAHIGDPAVYDNSDDIWVTARNRQLFADTLSALGPRLGLEPVTELGIWADANLAQAWAGIPQLLQYNRRSLDRGRTPRPLVADQLRGAAAAEAELLKRLGETLDAIGAPGGPDTGPAGVPRMDTEGKEAT